MTHLYSVREWISGTPYQLLITSLQHLQRLFQKVADDTWNKILYIKSGPLKRYQIQEKLHGIIERHHREANKCR